MAPLKESRQFGGTASVNSEGRAIRKPQREHLFLMVVLWITCLNRSVMARRHQLFTVTFFQLTLFFIFTLTLKKPLSLALRKASMGLGFYGWKKVLLDWNASSIRGVAPSLMSCKIPV